MSIMLNNEKYHHQMFKAAEAFAWAYGRKRKERVSVVMSIDADKPIVDPAAAPEERLMDAIMTPMEFQYTGLGTFDVPAGSRDLVFSMARYSIVSPVSCAKIVNTPGIGVFPYETFCLESLLQSAFPRSAGRGIIRFTIGGMMLSGDLLEDEEDEALNRDIKADFQAHYAFAGFGIILMNSVRRILGPLMLDNEVIQTAERKELLLVFHPGESEE